MTAGRKPPKPGWADFKRRFDALSEDDRQKLLDVAEAYMAEIYMATDTTTAEAAQEAAAEPPTTDRPTAPGQGHRLIVDTPRTVVNILETQVMLLKCRAEILRSCLETGSVSARDMAAEDLLNRIDDLHGLWREVVTAVGMRQ